MTDARQPAVAPVADSEKTRALPWSIAANALAAVSIGWTFSGPVFLLFLDRLGLDKAQIGAVLALISFCGLLSLVLAPAITRWGRKRVYIGFWAARYLCLLLLVALPWLTARGVGIFPHLAGLILCFAVCRAVAETAGYPWGQEYVPDAVRGRYGAVSNVISSLLSAGALALASWLLRGSDSLAPFQWLIAAGCVAGLASAALMLPVPGGRPFVPSAATGRGHVDALRAALRDRNFQRFLIGTGGFVFGAGLIGPFLPLFVRDELGVATDRVVLLDGVTLVAGTGAGFFWGWLADRFGSRPAKIPSLSLLLAVPVCWLLFPRNHAAAFSLSAAVYALAGVASIGVAIGTGRILFTAVVPIPRSTEYLALHYAWMGLLGGLAPLVAGRILRQADGWRLAAGPVIIDGYALLFAAGGLCYAASLAAFAKVTPDGPVDTRDVLFLVWRRLFLRSRL